MTFDLLTCVHSQGMLHHSSSSSIPCSEVKEYHSVSMILVMGKWLSKYGSTLYTLCMHSVALNSDISSHSSNFSPKLQVLDKIQNGNPVFEAMHSGQTGYYMCVRIQFYPPVCLFVIWVPYGGYFSQITERMCFFFCDQLGFQNNSIIIMCTERWAEEHILK